MITENSDKIERLAIAVKENLKLIPDWSLKTRLQWLKQLDDLLALNKGNILSTVAREKNESEHNVLLNEYFVIRSLYRYYRYSAERILESENRSRLFSLNWANKKVLIKKEPLGLIGVITPANYPFSLPMGAVISAILSGNGVLLKPADMPQTNVLIQNVILSSLERFKAGRIFEILPPNVEFGQKLVKCPLVDKIHFTGSVAAGQSISRENARVRLIPPTLELGGSNAAIVLEDADIKKTASMIVWARFCGMSCNNLKRIFVVAPIYEEICAEAEKQIKQLQDHEIGQIPGKEIINYKIFLEDYREIYPNKVIGEEIRPRVLRVENAGDNLLVLQEETFVPLLPIVKVKDETEAIELANRSRFGLGASVFTADKKRFQAIAEKLECGGVFHNDAMTEFAQPQVPFGGWKESGFGYSHGPEGLLEFVRLKTVIAERWPAPKLQLYPWTECKMKWLRKFVDWIIKLS